LIWRFAALFWAGVMYWVVLLSDARLGVIGCLLTMLLYALAWGALQWQRRKDSIFGPAVVLSYPALAVAAFAATLVVGRLREKIWGSGQYDASTEGRKVMYQEGIPMILSHPWGFGAGMGAARLGITNPAGYLTIDTYYILIGLDYGLLGFIGYYGMIAWATYRTGRWALEVKEFGGEYSYFMPLSISLLNFFYIKAVFSNEENHPLVFMMMGLGLGMGYRLLQERKPALAAQATRPFGRFAKLLGRNRGVPQPQGAPAYSTRRTPPPPL
ncbi:MAG: O-antigen ligase family protein, partial [Proteobacteria bacterium]|nr:O-antigen ligase family protein [Pseudomonadota bacterium]